MQAIQPSIKPADDGQAVDKSERRTTGHTTGPKHRALTEHETAQLSCRLFAGWSQNEQPRTRRNALIVSLALHGLRSGEIRILRANDLATSGVLYVHTTKKGINRRIQLDTRFAAALADEVAASTTRQPLQTNPLIFTRRTGEALTPPETTRLASAYQSTIPRLTLHSLRHTAAVQLYRRTRDVYAVQHLLGHRTLGQTHVYLRSAIEAAIDGMPEWPNQARQWRTIGDPQPATVVATKNATTRIEATLEAAKALIDSTRRITRTTYYATALGGDTANRLAQTANDLIDAARELQGFAGRRLEETRLTRHRSKKQ